MRHVLTAALFVAALPIASFAQEQAGGPILTLEEAITIALRNNPTHLQSQTARSRQGASLRSAYGAWLPTVSSSFGTGFRAGGTEIFAGQSIGASSDQLSSSYSIGVNASWSGASLMRPRFERASLEAAEADVTSSAAQTRSQVVTQYLNVLRAQARAALQDTLLANNQAQLELNRAREQVGAITSLEVRRSEVQLGQTQVNLLRERNSMEIELLRLFQLMGTEAVPGARLTTSFPVSEPSFQLQELLDMAERANPALNAARARESAAQVGVAQARSSWLPRLSFNTGWSGNTQKATNLDPQIASAMASAAGQRASCLTTDSIRLGAGLTPRGICDNFVFTPADEQAIRDRNDQFPFSFNKNPFSYSVGVSLPLFDGFQREQSIQNASLSRSDARYRVRAQELQINTDVTSAFRNLVTQYQMVQLQEQNRAASQQALDLAQERYRVGASTFIDVTQARADFETAGNLLINAIYDFHTFYAQLEAAVGRPLR
jgi:outer membrane protein